MVRICGILLGLLVLSLTPPARACSVVDTYVRPSNFELVQLADAIVVARPVRPLKGDFPSVSFAVETAIKGSPPPRFTARMAALGRTLPSDLTDLSASHPEGHMGPCNRMTFKRGGRYLIFLARGKDGSWGQLGYPFSRINEDYRGADNPWTRTVRRYLALQHSLPPMEQLAALRRLLETGQGADGRALSAEERRDAADHLRSISKWKPTAYLIDLYDRIERGEPLPFGTRPDEENGEAGNLDEIAALLLDEPQPPKPQGIERERLMILNALVEGDHGGAMPLFERLWSAPDLDGASRGRVLRYFAEHGQYPRVFEWIETRLPEISWLSWERPSAAIPSKRSRRGGEACRGPWRNGRNWHWRYTPTNSAHLRGLTRSPLWTPSKRSR
jgi:hypothetical protein